MQKIKLNLTPGKVAPVCYASQGDVGLAIRFLLFDGETALTLSGTEVITLAIKKADGSELEESVTNTGSNYVDVITTADTCDTPGASLCELRFQDGGDDLGTGNFIMEVEADAYAGANIEERTASGSIANFETNLQDNLTACKCTINPLQDLHGYTKPWSGGTGKNKVDFPSYAYASYNGLTIQTTGDGGIKFSGTPTLTWALLTSVIDCSIPTGTTITFGINHTLTCRIYVYITYSDNTTANFVVDAPNTSATMTLAKDVIKVRLDLASMSTSTNYNETIYPMLEYGNTQSAFEPYENICPISGFSGANITRCGKNLLDFNPVTVTTQSRIVDNFTLKAGNYVASFHIKNTTAIAGYFQIRIGSTSLGGANFGANVDGDFSKSFTLTEDSTINILVGGASSGYSYQFSNGQIELGSTATAYKPYIGPQYAPYFEGLLNGSYGFVDLGSLSWQKNGTNRFTSIDQPNDINAPSSQSVYAKIACPNYQTSNFTTVYSESTDKVVAINTNKAINIVDTAYSDATAFKNAMDGVYLIYELATPTTPTITQSQIDTLINAFNDDLTSVVFGQEVYGGVLDVTNGKSTITHESITLEGTETWYYTSTLNRVYTPIADAKRPSLHAEILSDILHYTYNKEDYGAYINDQGNLIVFAPASITDANSWKTWLGNNNIQVVYELATPTEITLTPKQIETLVNQVNNVYHDCNGETEVGYLIEV